MPGPRPVLIMAGGTGGHVYPALAVARRLMQSGVPVVWLGTRQGLEARVVPQAGIPIEWLSVSGLRGKRALTWLLAPLRLLLALAQAMRAVVKHRPRAVLGLGGFVAGPGGLAACLLGKPLVLHEQNAVLGLTNRLLAPCSRVRLSGFPQVFGKGRCEHVGNPVRADIAALPPPEQRYAQRRGPIRLLVLGGSQGAKALNEILPQALAMLPAAERPQVWHQAGKSMIEDARHAYAELGVEARMEPFIEDMAQAYAWADLVVCRSGALTVAELAAAGVASILVPFPHAVDDHQRVNGEYLSTAKAAVLIGQAELEAGQLAKLLREFGCERSRLLSMASAARNLALPEATERVVQACLSAGSCRKAGPAAAPAREHRA